jgi:hypothetical protein
MFFFPVIGISTQMPMQVQHRAKGDRRQRVGWIVMTADVELIALVVVYDVDLFSEWVPRAIGGVIDLYPVIGGVNFFKAKFTAIHYGFICYVIFRPFSDAIAPANTRASSLAVGASTRDNDPSDRH